MKILKAVIATFVAIMAISSASAQTVIHITGSTAYRTAVYYAINDILQPGFVFGYSGTSGVVKANQAIFTGTTKTTNLPVIIKTSFSGSVGGISTLAAGLTIGPMGTFTGGGGWLVDSTGQSGVTGAWPNGGTGGAPANYDPAVTADMAMADCFQASAPAMYRTPILTDHIVGVVPFVFVATKGTAALGTVSNITSAQVKTAFVSGTLKLSALSGNSGDTESVLAVGRDEDSGTRIQTLACSTIGVETALQQYQPLFNGNLVPTDPPPAPAGNITGAALWPAKTLNGIKYPLGDSGYNSGGTLATAVSLPRSGYGNWFITPFGLNDAATAIAAGGIELTFNGKSYSTANVEGPEVSGFTGQYAFWGYEHLFYAIGLKGNASVVVKAIQTDLTAVSAVQSGILISAMKVSRDTDGGKIEDEGKPGT